MLDTLENLEQEIGYAVSLLEELLDPPEDHAIEVNLADALWALAIAQEHCKTLASDYGHIESAVEQLGSVVR